MLGTRNYLNETYLPNSRARYLQMDMVSGILMPPSISRQGSHIQGKSVKKELKIAINNINFLKIFSYIYIYIYSSRFIYLMPWTFVCNLRFHEVLQVTLIWPITKKIRNRKNRKIQ